MPSELERLLAQAYKGCPDCHGTGLIEGERIYVTDDTYTRDPDKICHCVPIMIIHALDDDGTSN